MPTSTSIPTETTGNKPLIWQLSSCISLSKPKRPTIYSVAQLPKPAPMPSLRTLRFSCSVTPPSKAA